MFKRKNVLRALGVALVLVAGGIFVGFLASSVSSLQSSEYVSQVSGQQGNLKEEVIKGVQQDSSGRCWPYGTIRASNVTLTSGVYCFSVIGSGATVNYTTGAQYSGFILNFSEIVRFYDAYGNLKYAFYEPTHHGYAYGDHAWRTGINGQAWAGGRACGTLVSSGVEITTECVSIL